jgi:hypothetical protein
MKESDSRGILLIADSTEAYMIAQYILRRGDGSSYQAR